MALILHWGLMFLPSLEALEAGDLAILELDLTLQN